MCVSSMASVHAHAKDFLLDTHYLGLTRNHWVNPKSLG